MREAGHSLVEVEPQLQELSGEVFEDKSANKEADARSDIKCCGFWSNKRQAYFDVKVVSPFARSYAHLKPAQLFHQAERAKIREYRERIRSRTRRLQPTCFHMHWRHGPSMPLSDEETRRAIE